MNLPQINLDQTKFVKINKPGFISRIVFNGQIPDYQAIPKNIYQEHQLIWSFFPENQGLPRKFIFRKDVINNFPVYLIVSEFNPVVSHPWSVQTKRYAPVLEEENIYNFTVRLNPTYDKYIDGRLKHFDVVSELSKEQDFKNHPNKYNLATSAITEWLKFYQHLWGFEIYPDSIVVNDNQYHEINELTKKFEKANGPKKICFSSYNITGKLMVTNVDLMKYRLFKGFGRSRAFGNGLLLIKP